MAAPERKRTNLRLLAYEAIKERISEGDLLPGTALSESEWAEELHISRTPVREAVQMLAQEGLVEVLPKRGTLVARLSVRDVRESFEIREAIEGYAARLAAERRTDEQLAAMRDALGNSADPYNRGASFHELVVEAADNTYLMQSFTSAEGRIDLASRLAAKGTTTPHTPGSTHEAVLRAIEAGDADGAESAMRRHLEEHAASLIARLM
jgi:DNA-binding GntR family transcriptional regulator